jgi:putative endonuclease
VINRSKGIKAEALAEKYLTKVGYSIVAKNWTCRWGEIDLIARHKEVLVFVEVKYRSSDLYGNIDEIITPSKRRHLTRSVNLYLLSTSDQVLCWRIDLIYITYVNKRLALKHFKEIS